MQNLWLTLVGSIVYLLPTLISFQKKNLIQVFLLNLFTGMTIIGWFIALKMALTSDNLIQKNREIVLDETEEYYKTEILNLENLYNKGFINLNEVSEIRNRILNRK